MRRPSTKPCGLCAGCAVLSLSDWEHAGRCVTLIAGSEHSPSFTVACSEVRDVSVSDSRNVR